jgi:hypothetical protein
MAMVDRRREGALVSWKGFVAVLAVLAAIVALMLVAVPRPETTLVATALPAMYEFSTDT